MSVLTPLPTTTRDELRVERPTVSAEERSHALAWMIGTIATIWVAVALISVFAPDNVSGSEQDHLAIAAILTWIWGILASRSLATVVIRRRNTPGVAATSRLLAIAVIPIWAIAAVVGVFGPEIVTGSDPTRLPISAIIAPIAAMVLTQVIGQVLTAFEDDEKR